MIKFKLVFSLLLLLGYSQVYAQFEIISPAIRNIETMKLSTYVVNGANVDNVPLEDYYIQNWEVASITFNNNYTQKFDNVRYNLNKKEVEIRYDDKVYSLPVSEVNKLNFTQLRKSLVSDKNKKVGLLEEYHKNENILFMIGYNVLKSEQGNVGYSLQNEKVKTKKTESYYLIKDNEDAFKLSKNKKKNAKFFGGNWKEIESFIKKEKISFKKKDNIIKVIDFYVGLKG